ncbi:MAG: TM0106 family RecB-like putative nuclease [Planctomycetaceae bacterium]
MQKSITISGGRLTEHYAHEDPLETCLMFRKRFGHLFDLPPIDLEPAPDMMMEMAGRFGIRHEEEVAMELKDKFGEEFVSIGKQDNDRHKTRQIDLTLEAMRHGKRIIHAGYLKMSGVSARHARELVTRFELPAPVVFWGEPDVLRRVDAPGCGSTFGDYYYEVADVKSARTSKLPARLQVAFYSWLLNDLQELLPERGYVLPCPKEPDEGSVTTWEAFQIETVLPIAELFVREGYWKIALAEPSELFSTKGYKTPLSKAWAKKQLLFGVEFADSDIAVLPGMRLAARRRLQPHGIQTIRDLAQLDDGQLAKCVGPGATRSGLEKQRTQAEVCISSCPRWRATDYHCIQDVVDELSSNQDVGDQLDSIPFDNESIPIVHFDIEGDPFRSGIEYLFGYQVDLPGDRPRAADSYEPVVQIWAEEATKAGEQRAFEQFLEAMESLMTRYTDLVIIHYANYEATRLNMLADRYRVSADGKDNRHRVELLGRRLLDLYGLIRRAMYLPFWSYSIKDVAPGLASLPTPGGQGRGHEWLNFADQDALQTRMRSDGWRESDIQQATAHVEAVAGERGFDVPTILDAAATRGVMWYEQYCLTDEPIWKYLTNVYNADDLVATQRLYDYLLRLERDGLAGVSGVAATD